MARCLRSTVQKVKVRKWLTLKEKMKVVDEVKRTKPVMDVAAEFGAVLCYYSRLCKVNCNWCVVIRIRMPTPPALFLVIQAKLW